MDLGNEPNPWGCLYSIQGLLLGHVECLLQSPERPQITLELRMFSAVLA